MVVLLHQIGEGLEDNESSILRLKHLLVHQYVLNDTRGYSTDDFKGILVSLLVEGMTGTFRDVHLNDEHDLVGDFCAENRGCKRFLRDGLHTLQIMHVDKGELWLVLGGLGDTFG